jgi:hypothetical protein
LKCGVKAEAEEVLVAVCGLLTVVKAAAMLIKYGLPQQVMPLVISVIALCFAVAYAAATVKAMKHVVVVDSLVDYICAAVLAGLVV